MNIFTLFITYYDYNQTKAIEPKAYAITHVDTDTIFQAIQSPYLVVAADYPALTIIAQNEAHANISLSEQREVLGKPLLEAFPDTSEGYIKEGKSAVAESMHAAIKTGKPDVMPITQYDLKDADGNWVVRFWKLTHFPVFKDGKLVAVYQETRDVTKERSIEQRLNKTKNELNKVLATSKVGTWSCDLKTDRVTVDKNLAKMFGMTAAVEVTETGLPLERFIESISAGDQQRVQQQIDRAIKSGKTYESEYQTSSGTWVLARGSVDYDDTGRPNVFSGTIIDITDRKLAEHELVESENRLRFMADAMPQLVWITRPDGYHEYYNLRWYEYTGSENGDTDGDGWNDLFHPADQVRARKAWRHSLKTGEPYEIEYRLYHAPSDSYRWVIGRALPLRDETGSIVKWYGTCTDIDEQRHSSTQQSFLADVSKELVASLDNKKTLAKITKLSVPTIADWCSVDMYSEERGFEQVSLAHANPKKIGLARDYRRHNPLHIDDDSAIPNMIRTGVPQFFPKITEEMIRQNITDPELLKFMLSINLCSMMIVPIKQGRKVVGGISFVSSDSGRYFNDNDFQMANELANRVSLALTNAKLYEDSVKDLNRRRDLEKQLRNEKQLLETRVEERTAQLRLTNQGLRDEITKRQMAEKELNEYSNELTRSNKELEDFAYVASHDLQEPLRKIQAFSNLLKSDFADVLGEEGSDYLSRMNSAANRMSTLIEDLLVFSRVTRKYPEKQDIDLNRTLADVMSDLETRIKDTGSHVKIGKLPVVHADPTHMRQLFQNLVGNALKFHKPGQSPLVTVSSRQKKGGFEITVADDGIGFDEKYLDRIFTVFQRLHERSKYEGTGIGLAVCRKIVERYDGTITAVSAKNEGAKFVVWLPGVKVKKGTQ